MRMRNGHSVAKALLLVACPLMLFSSEPHAQFVREHDGQRLRSFHGKAILGTRRSFQSDAEARAVLQRILTAAGLAGIEDRIILRASAETNNAEAFVEDNERLIFYNAVFMQELARNTNDYWSMVAVLAHELGHHVRFHTVIPGREHEFELEADYQAGFILRRMGATLEQAQSAFRAVGTDQATPTHPARSQRLQAVTLGWTEGGSNQIPTRTQPAQKQRQSPPRTRSQNHPAVPRPPSGSGNPARTIGIQ